MREEHVAVAEVIVLQVDAGGGPEHGLLVALIPDVGVHYGGHVLVSGLSPVVGGGDRDPCPPHVRGPDVLRTHHERVHPRGGTHQVRGLHQGRMIRLHVPIRTDQRPPGVLPAQLGQGLLEPVSERVHLSRKLSDHRVRCGLGDRGQAGRQAQGL